MFSVAMKYIQLFIMNAPLAEARINLCEVIRLIHTPRHAYLSQVILLISITSTEIPHQHICSPAYILTYIYISET